MANYYTREEIAMHATENDFWLILGNKVYAFENFVHPGGAYVQAPFYGG